MSAFFYLILLPLFLIGCSSGPCERTEAIVCKSCKPYFVRGSWHYPQTYYEYEEEGLASWYGPGFAGKPKPYGESFDPCALTAAHRTLPLPTVAEVTNLETGARAVILIDDRGPFTYEGRIIDLSVGSAKVLGVYSKGLGRVRVRSLVKESRALSEYLTRYGKSARDKIHGRTWRQILDQEILNSSHRYPVQRVKPSSSTEVHSKGTVVAEGVYLPIGPQFQTLEGAKTFASHLVHPQQKYQKWVRKIVKQHEGKKIYYRVKLGPFTNSKEGAHVISEFLSPRKHQIIKLHKPVRTH